MQLNLNFINIVFLNHAILWMLVFCLAPFGLAYTFSKVKKSKINKIQILIQTIALIFIIAALANPAIINSQKKQNLLIMLDVSNSMKGQASLPAVAKNINFETKRFADSLNVNLKQNFETNITPALQYAIQKIKQNKISSLVIKTDGQIADIDSPAFWEIKTLASEKKIPLMILPADQALPFMRVKKIIANRSSDPEKVKLNILLQSNAEIERVLKIEQSTSQGKQVIYSQNIKMLPNESLSITKTCDVNSNFYSAFKANIENSNYNFPQQIAQVFPVSQKVLIICENELNDKSQLNLLKKIAFRKKLMLEIKSAKQCSTNPNWYKKYASVIIFSGAKSILPPKKLKSLGEAVQSGVGLFKFGVDTNPAVNLNNLRQKIYPLTAGINRRKPMNLTILLDASGSMQKQASANSKVTKFQLASDAVNSIRDLISKNDSLNIVTFSKVGKIIYKSNQAPSFEKISAALKKVFPAGPSNIFSGLNIISQLASEKKQNIAIVLTDFETEKFDDMQISKLFKMQNIKTYFVNTNNGEAKSNDLQSFSKKINATNIPCDDYKKLQQVFQNLCGKYRGKLLLSGSYFLESLSTKTKIFNVNQIIVSNLLDNSAKILTASDSKKLLPFLANKLVGAGRVLQVACPKNIRLNKNLINFINAEFLKTLRAENEKVILKILPSENSEKVELHVALIGEALDVDNIFVKAGGNKNMEQLIRCDINNWKLLIDSKKLGKNIEVYSLPNSRATNFELLGKYILPSRCKASELEKIGANFEKLRKLESGIGAKFITKQDLNDEKFLAKYIVISEHQKTWQYFAELGLLLMLISWVSYKKTA